MVRRDHSKLGGCRQGLGRERDNSSVDPFSDVVCPHIASRLERAAVVAVSFTSHKIEQKHAQCCENQNADRAGDSRGRKSRNEVGMTGSTRFRTIPAAETVPNTQQDAAVRTIPWATEPPRVYRRASELSVVSTSEVSSRR